MESFRRYEDLSAVIGRMYQKLRFDTNHFYSAQSMKEKIDEGLVSYEEGKFGAWILTDVGDYYLASIYLIRGEKIPKLREIDKPIIVELIGTEKRYAIVLDEALQAIGFREYTTNLELISCYEDVKKLIKVSDSGKKIFQRQGFLFHDMSELNGEYFEQIYKLWKDVIDPYAIHRLTKEEYKRLIQNDRGIFVTDAQGRMVGAGYYEKEGVISYAHHIAVLDEYNGLGLGGVVMNACAQKAFLENTEKYISWIAKDNEESMRMHKRMGTFSGKYSRQFMLGGK